MSISRSRIWLWYICNLFFFKFLVLVINHYHINGLHLFWDSFEWFCLQKSNDAKYFYLLPNRGLIVVIVYYFQIWNKKEHSIIISRGISSHMGPMYIDTPYTNESPNLDQKTRPRVN